MKDRSKGRKADLAPQLTSVDLQGSWREMGRQYGQLLKQEIRKTLAWANRCGNEESDSFFSPQGIPSGMDFMDDFMAGAAEGAELSLPELIRANGVEVAYGNQLTDLLKKGGRCGALAVAPAHSLDQRLMFCRNYDWLPDFADLKLVVTVLHPEGERQLASINFAGCFYLTTGMNEEGLFIELNSGAFASEVMHLERRQNAWELWNVLRGAGTVSEGLATLEKIPAAACYLIGLADTDNAAMYEWNAGGPSSQCPLAAQTGYLAFTNHFIREGWQNLPLAGVGGAASSLNRRQALVNLARNLPERASLKDVQTLMDVDVSDGGAKWSGTLFQVIAVPAERKLVIRLAQSMSWLEISSLFQ